MRPLSRTPAHNGQMPVRFQESRIPWTNDLSSRRGTPEPEDRKIPTNSQVSTNKKRASKIHRVCKILSKLHPSIVRETCFFFTS